ncbi:hypothetical protein NPIL_384971 [Nephila pilipes]|uniref:Uncharacterized protein n=1 Tax=Nephila pilipes TaxID=299642 RepID=A0A8X6QBY5_NEPPI|nr:hypothetical protein NPIL_384971 [Nephila pilipes]
MMEKFERTDDLSMLVAKRRHLTLEEVVNEIAVATIDVTANISVASISARAMSDISPTYLLMSDISPHFS